VQVLYTIVAVLLVNFSVALLGVAAIVWGKAILTAQQVRSNAIALAGQEETVRAASEAIDEIGERRAERGSFTRHGPPDATDSELVEFARMQSGNPEGFMADEGRYTTTNENEARLHFNGEAEIPRDRLYAE
jgi:hypothetical protein